jgi:hypothetical protein
MCVAGSTRGISDVLQDIVKTAEAEIWLNDERKASYAGRLLEADCHMGKVPETASRKAIYK